MRTSLRFLTLFSFLVAMSATSAFGLCVNEKWSRLRQGPSLNFEVTWEVFRYMPLEKLSKRGGWYRVKDVDGKIHWIREDMVTQAFKCVVIKDEFANLRTGPGTQYAQTKVGRGDKYLSFRMVDSQGQWVKVEDSAGDVSWIYKPLVWIQ